jgi:signal transduction histidine kinase
MVLDKSDPEIREALGILDKEVMNSEHIIKSLLEFAHPGPITREKTSINNVIYDTVNSISIPDTIKVLYRLDKNLPQVKADISKLDQIFRNVILNAVQAMPKGGKLAIMTDSEDSEWVNISITDTGTGIKKENLNNIFEPLFTTKAKGIGLGLAYTKILVEEHKGSITVLSKVGKGSTFTINIPIEPEDTGAKELYEEKTDHSGGR